MKKQPLEAYKPVEKLELKEIVKEQPKVFKKVFCPSCGGEVSADNLALQTSMAKCGTCNVIFSIEEEVEIIKSKKEMKQEIFRPEGIDLFFFHDDLDIEVQQHIQGLDLAGLIFLPILAIFSTLVYFIKENSVSPLIPFAFAIGAFYYIYRALNYSKNKTYITVNDKLLSIQSRPKHFIKDRTFRVTEIDQLYLKNAMDGSGYFTIQMIVNGVEGQKHVKLITLNTLSKAKYLEQEIEKYLKIEDREVAEGVKL